AAPALPELKGAMRARERVIRHDAFNTLVRMGPKGVPALADALRDRSPAVRWRAAHALLRLGPDARAAVPALADHVRSGTGFKTRVLAAMALGRLGPLA